MGLEDEIDSHFQPVNSNIEKPLSDKVLINSNLEQGTNQEYGRHVLLKPLNQLRWFTVNYFS